jgi:hypothetical protein
MCAEGGHCDCCPRGRSVARDDCHGDRAVRESEVDVERRRRRASRRRCDDDVRRFSTGIVFAELGPSRHGDRGRSCCAAPRCPHLPKGEHDPVVPQGVPAHTEVSGATNPWCAGRLPARQGCVQCLGQLEPTALGGTPDRRRAPCVARAQCEDRSGPKSRHRIPPKALSLTAHRSTRRETYRPSPRAGISPPGAVASSGLSAPRSECAWGYASWTSMPKLAR